jgi:hypothetical protein
MCKLVQNRYPKQILAESGIPDEDGNDEDEDGISDEDFQYTLVVQEHKIKHAAGAQQHPARAQNKRFAVLQHMGQLRFVHMVSFLRKRKPLSIMGLRQDAISLIAQDARL